MSRFARGQSRDVCQTWAGKRCVEGRAAQPLTVRVQPTLLDDLASQGLQRRARVECMECIEGSVALTAALTRGAEFADCSHRSPGREVQVHSGVSGGAPKHNTRSKRPEWNQQSGAE